MTASPPSRLHAWRVPVRIALGLALGGQIQAQILERELEVDAGIRISESYTDNVLFGAAPLTLSDLITSLTPMVTASYGKGSLSRLVFTGQASLIRYQRISTPADFLPAAELAYQREFSRGTFNGSAVLSHTADTRRETTGLVDLRSWMFSANYAGALGVKSTFSAGLTASGLEYADSLFPSSTSRGVAFDLGQRLRPKITGGAGLRATANRYRVPVYDSDDLFLNAFLRGERNPKTSYGARLGLTRRSSSFLAPRYGLGVEIQLDHAPTAKLSHSASLGRHLRNDILGLETLSTTLSYRLTFDLREFFQWQLSAAWEHAAYRGLGAQRYFSVDAGVNYRLRRWLRFEASARARQVASSGRIARDAGQLVYTFGVRLDR